MLDIVTSDHSLEAIRRDGLVLLLRSKMGLAYFLLGLLEQCCSECLVSFRVLAYRRSSPVVFLS